MYWYASCRANAITASMKKRISFSWPVRISVARSRLAVEELYSSGNPSSVSGARKWLVSGGDSSNLSVQFCPFRGVFPDMMQETSNYASLQGLPPAHSLTEQEVRARFGVSDERG